MARTKAHSRPPRPANDAATPAPADAAASSSAPGWMCWTAIAVIVLAIFAVYSPSIGHPFVFDDVKIELELADAASLGELLRESSRPVVSLTFWFNEAMSGLDPAGFRLFNIVIHVLAAVVLFDLVRRLASFARPSLAGRPALLLGFAAALLWGLHPLNTQAVAYIVQRAESLMGLCYLLVAWCMTTGASRSPRWPWLTAGIVVCAIGMGTKSVMATAPVVVLLLDWLLVGRDWKAIFRTRGWFYAGLAATWSVLLLTGVLTAVLGLKSAGGAGGAEGGATDAAATAVTPGAAGFAMEGVTPIQYLTTQAEVIPHYLRLAVWPDPLVIDYQWPFGKSIGDVLLPGAFIAVLLGATVVLLVRRHWFAAIGVWFFAILAPTSSFVPVADAAFEHRMYLPLIAVVVALLVGAAWLLNRLPRSTAFAAGLVLLVAASAAFGARTVARLADYRSNLVLWAATVEDRPQNLRARLNYGVNLYRAGEREAGAAQVEAFVRENPEHGFANFQYGLMLLELGRNEDAALHLRIAVDNHTTERATRFDLAQAQLYLGIALLRTSEPRAALDVLLQARRAMPDDAKTTRFTGAAYLTLGQGEPAERLLREAVRQAKASGNAEVGADAWFNLGYLSSRRGDWAACEAACRAALALVPDHQLAAEWLRRARRAQQQSPSPRGSKPGGQP